MSLVERDGRVIARIEKLGFFPLRRAADVTPFKAAPQMGPAIVLHFCGLKFNVPTLNGAIELESHPRRRA